MVSFIHLMTYFWYLFNFLLFLDISQLDRIDWIACTNGVSFYGFMGTSGDGLLKIAPHSQKSTARTKESTLVSLINFFKASC